MKAIKNILKSYKRVAKHRKFIYDRIIQIHNNISNRFMTMNLESEVEVIRKMAKNKKQTSSYLICKITKDDLDLLNESKKELALARKYKRRLKLLEL